MGAAATEPVFISSVALALAIGLIAASAHSLTTDQSGGQNPRIPAESPLFLVIVDLASPKALRLSDVRIASVASSVMVIQKELQPDPLPRCGSPRPYTSQS